MLQMELMASPEIATFWISSVNRHADENEKSLKAQRKQAFQVVLPHV